MALTRQQTADLRAALEARQQALLERVREEIRDSEEHPYIELLDRVPGDVGDASVADALADLGLAIIDRHIEELRDIEAALRRIREGTYGVCIACGGEIEYARLRAYSTAKRCARCQAQHERTHAHAGTPTL
ncbi:MAG TPA: TraR/DksA family transcriptional regulator [Casimicrobiaceae bacterium]|nr:TraR/DksA family transcriptional regulator [Casimicrobiaceae bacterium]